MDTMLAFVMGEVNRGKEPMVFDWIKAAKIIKEQGVKNARAGLSGDWEYTGGDILVDGKIPEESYTYLSSTWATPELEIDGDRIDCFVMQDKQPEWNSKTFWPDEAKKILNS
jgi:hypothetical protein